MSDETTVIEALRLLRSMEDGNRPWEAEDQETACYLRAIIASHLPAQQRARIRAQLFGRACGKSEAVALANLDGVRYRHDVDADPWPAVETALAQAAGARLQPMLEAEEADCYVFADGEGLWYTTSGGPTPGRQPLLTGGAMLREGMPARVLQRLLSMVRSGGEDYGLTLEEPAVVCEACGAFGWGNPVESLGWQIAGTEEDGTLHFCPPCRYEEGAVDAPAEPTPDVVPETEMLAKVQKVYDETIGRLERKLEACADIAAGIGTNGPLPVTAENASVAYSEILRLRVKYEALRAAYLAAFAQGQLDVVEATALRTRGMEP